MDKQKLCPYCGCDQTTIRFDPRYRAVFVECDQCYAAGPSVFESDLMDGFIDTASEPEIKAALGELAVKRWNCRPPMTNMTAEELADLEKKHSTTESWHEVVDRAKKLTSSFYGVAVPDPRQGDTWQEITERAKVEYEKMHSASLYGANCREG